MRKALTWFSFGILLFVMYVLSALLFNGRHTWMLLIMQLAVFGMSFYLFRRVSLKQHWYVASILLGPLLISLFTVSLGSGFRISFGYYIFLPLSCLLSWIASRRVNYTVLFFSLIFFLFTSFLFFPNAQVYLDNRNVAMERDFPGLVLLDNQQDTVILVESKIIVLDFWSETCGVCFKKFPGYEAVYQEYKDHSEIEMYAVFVPGKKSSLEKAAELFKGLNYSFPNLYAVSQEEVERLGIHAFPHLMILQNGKIAYSGPLVVEKHIRVNNLEREIDRLLK